MVLPKGCAIFLRLSHQAKCSTCCLWQSLYRCNTQPRRLSGTAPTPLLEPADLDWEYLCNLSHTAEIRTNILNRKGSGDIDKVLDLCKRLSSVDPQSDEYAQLKAERTREAFLIPNKSHPSTPIGDESVARTVQVCGTAREFTFKPKSCVEIGKALDGMRLENTLFTGPRSYYLLGDFAKLERALINYTIDRLKAKGFCLVSVPDLLPPEVISACGFVTTGPQNQIYRINKAGGGYCLAGTAEMSLASYFMNRTLACNASAASSVALQLPMRVCAWSRCFRAEEAKNRIDKDFYRVHQFTKVEMFGLTANESGNESEQLLQEFVQIQKDLFSCLGLHFRLLEMPTQELGRPAYRKYDIEAWMPAKGIYGEISSASNCTDYQSRRLHIKYKTPTGSTSTVATNHVHTVNATGCAVPRMLISIVENNQQEDGTVLIPPVLRPYMSGQSVMSPSLTPLDMRWIYKRQK